MLCKSYPVEFATYFHYCQSLTFDQHPDYGYLKRLFRDLFKREGIGCMFIIFLISNALSASLKYSLLFLENNANIRWLLSILSAEVWYVNYTVKYLTFFPLSYSHSTFCARVSSFWHKIILESIKLMVGEQPNFSRKPFILLLCSIISTLYSFPQA